MCAAEGGGEGWAFLVAQMVKTPFASAGELSWIPGSERSSGEGNGNPLQYSCLGNPMTEEPDGYSPWGCKELGMTEWLTLRAKVGVRIGATESTP